MRPLEDLINTDDPGWPRVREWIDSATNPVEIVPAERQRADRALVRTQVTTRSPMGAIIHETGGLIVDGGWLRVLGSGNTRLPRSLPDWNDECVGSSSGGPPPFLLIADDVVGGVFAINGGGLSGRPGAVLYFAPDTLAWEEHTDSYSDFLQFCFLGDLARFYKDSRWSRWREDASALSGESGFSIYPFLWADGPTIEERAREPVPMKELWHLQMKMASQMDAINPGS